MKVDDRSLVSVPRIAAAPQHLPGAPIWVRHACERRRGDRFLPKRVRYQAIGHLHGDDCLHAAAIDPVQPFSQAIRHTEPEIAAYSVSKRDRAEAG